MAINILALNGIGLGHLSRLVEISDFLYANGEKPILFYQCEKFPFKIPEYPVIKINSLLKSDHNYVADFNEIINTSCSITTPNIFIEDTHPANLNLSKAILKYLIVRPTTFEYLFFLNEKYSEYYHSFFIADHFESPSWPYSEDETNIILSWPKWYLIDPIFRKPSDNATKSLQKKYYLEEHESLFIFSMGGGGQQKGANDAKVFLQASIEIIPKITANFLRTRLIFIKGPLFPSDIVIPDVFQSIDSEEEMPALFSLATVAIIRPSYNSIWECVNQGTPFYIIKGTTFSEPIDYKIQQLKTLGLYLQEDAFNISYHRDFKSKCKDINKKWNGRPNQLFLNKLNQKSRQKDNFIEEKNERKLIGDNEEIKSPPNDLKIFIRIDDVYNIDHDLRRFITHSLKINLFISLEIIPYLNTIRDNDLSSLDPDCKQIVVSQHGYHHLLNLNSIKTRRSEFDFSTSAGALENERNLLLGKKIMEDCFPSRFKQGFSAPFDAYPKWAQNFLESNYKYVSAINLPEYITVKNIKASVDIWDWSNKTMRPIDEIRDSMQKSIQKHGYCGIVIHPIHLKSKSDKVAVYNIIDELSFSFLPTFNFVDYLKNL